MTDKKRKGASAPFLVDNKHSFCDTNPVSTTTQEYPYAYYQARPKENGNRHSSPKKAPVKKAKPAKPTDKNNPATKPGRPDL